MKYETIYKYVGLRLAIASDNCVKKDDLKELITAAHNKTIAKSKHKKVYYACSKFPRKIAQRAGFITVTDPDDADLIVIPVECGELYTAEWYAERVEGKLRRRMFFVFDTNPELDIYVSVYKQMNKYIDLMDEYKDKCVISSNFYIYCRHYNPALTDEELDNIKNLLYSSDKECRLLGATMIMQSNLNIRKNEKIIRKVYDIFPKYEPIKTYTNELHIFMKTVSHKSFGHYSQFVIR